MRNGVLAITREGTLALINDIACEVLGLQDGPRQLGRPIAEAFKDHPEILFVLADVFERDHLQNRAEMRLKPSGKVMARRCRTSPTNRARSSARPCSSRTSRGSNSSTSASGCATARGHRRAAAVFAHEVKNPLAGIEVMAGHLRRKARDAPEVQKVLTDIIGEAKMANAIVQEVLDFVRPIRLQVEPTLLCDAVQAAVQHADAKGRRGNIAVETRVPPTLPHIRADKHQLTQVLTNLIVNAYEALDGEGHVP